jgi:hypothetical protein
VAKNDKEQCKKNFLLLYFSAILDELMFMMMLIMPMPSDKQNIRSTKRGSSAEMSTMRTTYSKQEPTIICGR